ncbi:MAG: YggS family pyridoxal phosphate-dependent enzyme [Chitinophagaceae bacterium]
MAIDKEVYKKIIDELDDKVTLVAVSKTKPVEDIKALYDLGQRDFGENYVQELVDKQPQLPSHIRWHYIGHLQSNKVKYIAPFVHLIHGVDSFKLLKEINKQAGKISRVIDCLLQVHIADEETKFGFDENELNEIFKTNSSELHKNTNSDELHELKNIKIVGLMGMASFTEDMNKVRKEFQRLKTIFDKHETLPIANCQLRIISMGMSADYKIAIEEGSTMVRIGSLIFGERSSNK